MTVYEPPYKQTNFTCIYRFQFTSGSSRIFCCWPNATACEGNMILIKVTTGWEMYVFKFRAPTLEQCNWSACKHKGATLINYETFLCLKTVYKTYKIPSGIRFEIAISCGDSYPNYILLQTSANIMTSQQSLIFIRQLIFRKVHPRVENESVQWKETSTI